ncbi:MAG: outer membrane beta-barrel protein [Pseudomonadota bacterium]
MKRTVWLTSTLAVLLMPLSAFAQTALYVGGSVGRGDINASDAKIASQLRDLGNTIQSVAFDGEDSAYRVYAGVHLTEYFAVELGYADLGSSSTDIVGDATDKLLEDAAAVAPAMPRGPTLTGVAYIPTTLFGVDDQSNWSRLSLFLKLGFIDSDTRGEATVNGEEVSRKVDKAETLYGVGLQWKMTDRVSFRAEVEAFDYDRSVRYPSASLQFRF